MNLKTLLLAHRDCPVSHQQGLAGATMNQVIGADFAAQSNPYNMGMAQNGGPMPGQPVMHAGPGMQRRWDDRDLYSYPSISNLSAVDLAIAARQLGIPSDDDHNTQQPAPIH